MANVYTMCNSPIYKQCCPISGTSSVNWTFAEIVEYKFEGKLLSVKQKIPYFNTFVINYIISYDFIKMKKKNNSLVHENCIVKVIQFTRFPPK